MTASGVDQFVETRVLPEFRPVVAMIRELMREVAPQVQEVIAYGIPAYRGRKILAVVSPTKKDITLSLSRGAQMEDRYRLLRGVGRSSRHMKIKSVGQIDRRVLRYYIRQAVKLDEL
jgi:hypothetical protein